MLSRIDIIDVFTCPRQKAPPFDRFGAWRALQKVAIFPPGCIDVPKYSISRTELVRGSRHRHPAVEAADSCDMACQPSQAIRIVMLFSSSIWGGGTATVQSSMVFIVTIKRKFPNFVPWGLPPLTCLEEERLEFTLKLIERLCRNALIMPRDSVEALHSASARRQQAWSIRFKHLAEVYREESNS